MRPRRRWLTVYRDWAAQHSMAVVLLLLCALLSWLTIADQHPTGDAGAKLLYRRVLASQAGEAVLLVAGSTAADQAFAETLSALVRDGGGRVVGQVCGEPADARRAVDEALAAGRAIDRVVCPHAVAAWPLWQRLASLSGVPVNEPPSRRWPNFLKAENLLNIANQIVVIAVLAVGMTMVIITGGIDLSVGSLIALGAVVTALLVRAGGGPQAGVMVMFGAALGAVLVCGLVGLFTGVMVTRFAIPPFIVTLGMMLVASGLAYLLSGGQSIYQLPETFTWLGRGTKVGPLPNAVVLMLLLYLAGHWLMTRTTLGRAIYAVGGNREAARLSGVAVSRVLLFVYVGCAALAGLGGVITASQLRSGSPTYGLMYELYVIAAVVVGGTSLVGGSGTILGTLVGACIIAVIQNGMNLLGVESYTQKVVLGLVVLAAVLADTLRHGRHRD